MKKNILLALVAAFFLGNLAAQTPSTDWQNKVSPELRAQLERGEKANFFIVFTEKTDLSGAASVRGKGAKAAFVFKKLQETARRSQAEVVSILRKKEAFFNGFYLVNAISVIGGDLALVRLLASRPEVRSLAPDPEVRFSGAFKTTSEAAAARGAVEWGIDMINAPAVWAMGFTGKGITVGGADTGYEWWHPALQPHYRGYYPPTDTSDHNYNWHDAIHKVSPLNSDTLNPCGFNSKIPCDDNSHGTHTMGTMTGDDGNGNQIGVAPGARWVGCRNMERGWGRPSSYIECFEWFLAPTDLAGKNPDVTKAPHVINNSWYCSVEEGCVDMTVNELIHTALVNLRASGVVVVVSNGNSGSKCFSTGFAPAYFEESFSVGATDDGDNITGFSSRGPIDVDGSMRIKPNVAAPGAAVRSSVLDGGYAHFWGTSMAGPHVAGAVALILSAVPQLEGEVEAIETLLEKTAVQKFDTLDCGPSHGTDLPNHAFGFGRIDVLAAVNSALSVQTETPTGATPTAAVFPNPAQQDVIFEMKNFQGKTRLELFDATGKQVFSKNFGPAGQQFQVVSLANLPSAAGLFFWKISGENGVASGKVVLEK